MFDMMMNVPETPFDRWCDTISDRQLIFGTAALYLIVTLLSFAIDWMI